MGLDVAVVTMDYIDRPRGAAYDFAWNLAEDCAAWGEGNAFGFYMKDDLLNAATEYMEWKTLDSARRKEILDWIESLPYDGGDYITLNFNW